MKKIIFYISITISILLLINIIEMLITDFNRLTEYGYGYLIGKVILFVLFLSVVFFTRKKQIKIT
ncbi:hypothetical protein [Tenacibaculum aestuariivivum]|uniref:hypothetical protein n=1 Tax=Tenacibaculum aestuariivivum TaxID=2006131 RepID=UPI003AB3B121